MDPDSTGLVKCTSTGRSLASANGANEGDVGEHWRSIPPSRNAHGAPGRALATAVGRTPAGFISRTRKRAADGDESDAPATPRTLVATRTTYCPPTVSSDRGRRSTNEPSVACEV